MSSRRTSATSPALGAVPREEPSPQKTSRRDTVLETESSGESTRPDRAEPDEVPPEEVKPTDDTHRIAPPRLSTRKIQLLAASATSSRVDLIAALKDAGPYEDIREVARGGMGVVYKAREKHLKRSVAIKVLKGSTDDPEEVHRFRREAEAAARLQHSNIVPIHAVGEVLGRPFFVMDFIEGRVLSELIRSGELSPRAALDIVQQAARALHYAHSQGVIHRDMKPQNIIVDRLGRPQVMDFGLAKQLDEDSAMTRAGTTMGTPAYMPPEQAEGDTAAIDAQSDVYSLGAVLYEMLTGTPPFSGSSTMNILMKVLEEEPTPPREVNPRIHRDIETICLKAMSKEKSRRYATARELAEDIRRFHAGEAISAAPTTLLYRLKRIASRNKGAVVVIVALVLALGALTGWLLGQADRERRAQIVNEHRRLREMLDNAARAVERAMYLREVGEPGWRDRVLEKLDAARVDAEYVLKSRPGDGEAAAVAENARKMRGQLRVDEFLGHARDFLETDQHLAAETFYRIVLEDYDPENAEAAKGLKLARGVGRLNVTSVPAGIDAILLPLETEDGGGRTALG